MFPVLVNDFATELQIAYEALRQREAYLLISLRFFKLLGIHWN